MSCALPIITRSLQVQALAWGLFEALRWSLLYPCMQGLTVLSVCFAVCNDMRSKPQHAYPNRDVKINVQTLWACPMFDYKYRSRSHDDQRYSQLCQPAFKRLAAGAFRAPPAPGLPGFFPPLPAALGALAGFLAGAEPPAAALALRLLPAAAGLPCASAATSPGCKSTPNNYVSTELFSVW